MIRVWIVFILLVVLIVWGIFLLLKKRRSKKAPSTRFAAPAKPNEMWSQLYETDSLDEINLLRMRLGEEDLSFIVFEQGKRSLEGNSLKKYGIAVVKGHLSRAQTILAKLLS